MADTVLVTGITGFIGSNTAVKLLKKGYKVRGTARNPEKAEKVSVKICEAAGVPDGSIDIIAAELTSDEGWTEAVKDCRYIQHIASPLPIEPPMNREGLVPEARAGALRVLEAGFEAGAERIVMTSSIASMIGQKNRPRKFTFGEQDWSNPDWKKQTAYPVSKTRAELSAWEFAESQNGKDRLTTINPGLVFGPDSFNNGSASLEVVKALMIKQFPASPKLALPIIDVRDVASIHVAAMTAPKAAGRRLIAAGETLWFKEVAAVLKDAYPELKTSRGEMPNFALKFFSLFDERVKTLLADLGVYHIADTAYVGNITQVIPRSAKEAILATAASLIESGSVRARA
ncbi:MAG: SDR family NAD(P)-dependent oxidoreductase [Hellea sp.]|nr:SDR family NAD(P)-dependent oxidoreductase [Hellea sp.]